jgi:hypothetical protein
LAHITTIYSIAGIVFYAQSCSRVAV